MRALTFILSGMLLSFTALSQVQLEQSYNHSGTLTELTDGEYKYFMLDVPMEQCRIYNTDHTIYKTISLPAPEGYYLYDLKFVSRHIFDADDDIELLYVYQKIQTVNAQTIYYYGMKVIDENGAVMLTLENGAVAELFEVDNSLKLLAYQYIWYESYYLIYTNVYELGGTASAAQLSAEPLLRVYPNPVSRVLHVDMEAGTMQDARSLYISNMNGEIVLKEDLESEESRHTIYTGSLPAGTYIMNVETGVGILPGTKILKMQ